MSQSPGTLRVLCMKSVILTLLAAASMLSAADFFPLSPGNSWTLRSDRGATLEIKVNQTLLQSNDQTYYRLTNYRSEGTWLRLDEAGELHWLDLGAETTELLTRFDASRGTYTTRLGACNQSAKVSEKRVPWGAPGQQLPALHIEYQGGCPDNAISEELYLENIGLVRRTVTTFAGPVTYDLKQARVGNMLYQMGTGVTFDVSVPSRRIQSEAGEAVTSVTLRLATHSSDPVRLLYASSQQYDFRLLTPTGDLVWQWSRGRAFLPSVTEDQVTDRTWQVNIFLEGVTPGDYILEGALTNSGGYRCASSVPVHID